MHAASHLLLLVLVAPLTLADGSAYADSSALQLDIKAGKNPMRPIIDLMEKMHDTLTKEAEEAAKEHEDAMCNCKTRRAELEASIVKAQTTIPETESDKDKAVAKDSQLQGEIKEQGKDKKIDIDAIATAGAMRKEENDAYIEETARNQANIANLKKVIAALRAGMASSFLQNGEEVKVLKRILDDKDLFDNLDANAEGDDAHDILASFVQGQQGDGSPGTDQIIGICLQLVETMEADQKKADAKEKAAEDAYQELIGTKRKEVENLVRAIETNAVKDGDIRVSITEKKAELVDTKESVEDWTKEKKTLVEDCATLESEYQTLAQDRSDELVAISKALAILKDDDALEMFKKAPALNDPYGVSYGYYNFVQVKSETTSTALRNRALDILRGLSKVKGDHFGSLNLGFIELALKGKQKGYDFVVQMIEDMINQLDRDQASDSAKLKTCRSSKEELEHKEGKATDEESFAETDLENKKGQKAESEAKIKGFLDLVKAIQEREPSEKMALEKQIAGMREELSVNQEAEGILKKAKAVLENYYFKTLGLTQTNVFATARHQIKQEHANQVITSLGYILSDVEGRSHHLKDAIPEAQESLRTLLAENAGNIAKYQAEAQEEQGVFAGLEKEIADLTDDLDLATKQKKAAAKALKELAASCGALEANHEAEEAARNNEKAALNEAKRLLKSADASFIQKKSQRSKFLHRKL